MKKISKLFLVVLILNLIAIPLISSLEFDNTKSFDENYGKYGKVTIKNWFGLLDLVELELKTNTYYCGADCSANIEIIMYQKGVLIDDVKFVGGEVKNYDFYADGKPYKLGTEVDAGTYQVRLEGEKNWRDDVDWQITSQGILIDDWAYWFGLFIYSFSAENEGGTTFNPTGVATNGSVIAVSSDPQNMIYIYDMNGKWIKNKTTNASHVNVFGIDWNGSNWFGMDSGSTGTEHVLYKYDANWNYISGCRTSTAQTYWDIAINETQVFGITNEENIYRLDYECNELQNFKTPGGDKDGIARNESDLFISSNTNGNITKGSLGGVWSANFTTPIGVNSFGIDLYNEYMYVANYGSKEILIYLVGEDESDPPTITIYAPTGTLDYGGETQLINWSVSDASFVNTTWFNYNGTNRTLNGNTNSTNFNLATPPFNLTFYANDSYDNVNSSFVNWTYKIFLNNQTFNAQTTEGATEFFSLNFTKDSLLQVSTIDLIYNGTVNSFAYSVNGDIIISQGSIVISSQTQEVNVTFFYNIKLDDGSSINTTLNNQTIQIINMDDCSVFENLIYNFTQYDEEDKTTLTVNNTMEIQVNLFDTSKTLNLVNFSQTFFEVKNATICLEDALLTTVNYSAYVVVKYSANSTTLTDAYSVEYYNILNQTIANITVPRHIALYNLKEKDTTKFRLTFRDGSFVLAPNILVQVHRQYIEDNDFKIVEIPLTDNNGQTMLNLVRNDIVYNFIMVDESNNVIAIFNSVTVFCQDFIIGECTINLNAESIAEETYDYNEEFGISLTSPTFDNSTGLISITFITDDLLPKTISMDVLRNNAFGNRSVCSNSLTSASGTLSCNASAVTDSDQFLFVHSFVNGDQASQDTINLNASTLNFGIIDGAFYAFLIILLLITLFMEDKKILVISLGLGWVVVISLGLVSGRLVGATSAGIWIIVTIAIFLWKLNKEEGA